MLWKNLFIPSSFNVKSENRESRFWQDNKFNAKITQDPRKENISFECWKMIKKFYSAIGFYDILCRVQKIVDTFNSQQLIFCWCHLLNSGQVQNLLKEIAGRFKIRENKKCPKTKQKISIISTTKKIRFFFMLILVAWEAFISTLVLKLNLYSPILSRLVETFYIFFASLDPNELWNIVSWAGYQPTSSWLWVPCLTTTRLPVCQGAWKLNESILCIVCWKRFWNRNSVWGQ